MAVADSLQVHINRQDGEQRAYKLELATDSPLSTALGRWPLPTAHSWEEFETACLHAGELKAITFVGCPSSAFTLIQWLKSVHGESSCAAVIQWEQIDDPAGFSKRQAAGLLACALADEVLCSDPGRAFRLWGFDEHRRRDPVEAFDLMATLLQPTQLDDSIRTSTGWEEAIREAFFRCAAQGRSRIALYGAGTHTRSIGEALCSPEVHIDCIIDDDERRHGTRLWGFPIIAPEEVLDRGVDAIVLSANSIEDMLWERCQRYRDAGIAVERLYSG